MIQAASTEPEVLTREQAARKAQVSQATIDRSIAAGQLKVRRIGRRVLITKAAFTKWLEDESTPVS